MRKYLAVSGNSITPTTLAAPPQGGFAFGPPVNVMRGVNADSYMNCSSIIHSIFMQSLCTMEEIHDIL
jgi:hypothetical protein